MHLIGIRREDKNEQERRVALTPEHVAKLCREPGLGVVVEPSERRVFGDAAYAGAGATLSRELDACDVVLGIKEVPPDRLVPGKAHVFFSHTIKGQPYNMPLLGQILDLKCTLIDYECITDEDGRRLIFFGRHAGLAGMIDTLWALGRRLEHEGHVTPLLDLTPTHRYDSLEQAARAVRQVGDALRAGGLPGALTPLTFGVTGYGNVSQGAQEILDILGVSEILPDDLGKAGAGAEPLRKVVFREEHLVEPLAGAFDLADYYDNPGRYRSVFQRHVPHLHVLVNGIFWAPQYPRLVTLEDLDRLYAGGAQPRLRVIGDISCDVQGSVEATVKATEPDDPVYVYDVVMGRAVSGVRGQGPVIMAVDNLPAELPREASETFSAALMPFVRDLAATDYTAPFDDLDLPPPLKRAVIAHQGRLTPDYAYLAGHLERAATP